MPTTVENASPAKQVVDVARALSLKNLNRGTAGNVSVRLHNEPDFFLITPTGVADAELRPEDIVRMGLSGQAEGALEPSSEWRFHRDVYRSREEVGAVIHTHSPFATALACARHEIPPFHYMIARFGGPTLRCAAYATFGTQALSDNILIALEGRSACLMANHGMLVAGPSLARALDMAVELESLCEQYWRALQVGVPVLLSADEMEEVVHRFASYGQPRGCDTS